MKLAVMHDGYDIYLVDELTGNKVENLILQESVVTMHNNVRSVLGEPHLRFDSGRHEVTLKGMFAEVSTMIKEKIFVVARDQRDFSSYCLQNKLVPSKANGFGEIISITDPNMLRGYRVRQYQITPAAINNKHFQEIVEVLKERVNL